LGRSERSAASGAARTQAGRVRELGRATEGARGTANRQEFLLSRFRPEFTALLRDHVQRFQNPRSVPLEVRSAARLLLLAHRAERLGRALSPGLRAALERAVAQARYRGRVGANETTVEVEATVNDAIVAALTTRDGTVGPVLREGGQPAPEFLGTLASEGQSIEQIPWDRLSRQQKLALIESQFDLSAFHVHGRAIPGVVFRDELPVSPGSTTTSRRGSLRDRIEFTSQTQRMANPLYEFHVRQRGPASNTLRASVRTEAQLGVRTAYRHQHVTARLPSAIRRGDPIARAQLIEFYRRMNMIVELDRVARGGALMPNVTDGNLFFDWLSAENLGVLNDHLRSLAGERATPLHSHSQLKMAGIGFRPGTLYDDPNVIGFEVRTLSSTGEPPARYSALVDAVQRGLVGQRYGVSRGRIARWYYEAVEARSGTLAERESAALASLHYSRPIEAMLEEANQRMMLPRRVIEIFREGVRSNGALKLLLHDFRGDPALGTNRRVHEQISEAQRRAILAISEGTQPSAALMTFVRESRLQTRFQRSVGM
jgi:hypothetical protein